MEILRKLLGLKPRKYRYRSAISGVFVSEAFAREHPDTTVRERVA